MKMKEIEPGGGAHHCWDQTEVIKATAEPVETVYRMGAVN